MSSLLLILVALAVCFAFGALAAVTVAVFRLSFMGLEALAARRRRRRAAQNWRAR